MKTRNISMAQLHTALDMINQSNGEIGTYAENVKMELTEVYTVAGDARHNIKLGIVSSNEPGARYNQRTGRKIAAACWHVFGYFLDALGEVCAENENALVLLRNEDNSGRVTAKHPAEHGWIDYNIGSEYYPMMMSESCKCEELGIS